MRYVALDLETTGLKPEQGHQILEIGAIVDDLEVGPSPDYFHRYIFHETIVGHPIALAMNARIISKIAANPYAENVIPIDVLAEEFNVWLTGHNLAYTNVTFAGKNFNGFDRRFLKRVPGWCEHIHAHRRALDPAPLYTLPTDKEPPDLQTCIERAGITTKFRPHYALDDAQAVMLLIRAKLVPR